jgi:hypothetical protein
LEKDYFDLIDILIGFLYLLVVLVFVNRSKIVYDGKSYSKYYMPNFFLKLFFAFGFIIFYLLYYGGGDCTAYWDGARQLTQTFLYSPSRYYDVMFSESSNLNWSKHFNIDTGYPPGWIYREQQGWFVCKVASVFSLFTFSSFPATLVIVSFLLSNVTFKLYDIVMQIGLHNERNAAISTLFIPSVGFWCSGLTKDGIMYYSILSILILIIGRISLGEKISFLGYLKIILCFFLIFKIRPFILAAVLVPLLLSFSGRFIRNFKSSFVRAIFNLLIISFSAIGFLYFSSTSYLTELSNEAEVVQKDFANNSTYTGKKYELDITDFSAFGLVKVFPIATFYGIYRPFPNEALSPTLFFNGIEGLFLIFFTLAFFFSGKFLDKINDIRSHEFLIFSFVFVLLIGFMGGLTSMLFGVLVRVRSPLLPFIFLIFTTKSKNKIIEN